jgi:molecular chaperone DnaK
VTRFKIDYGIDLGTTNSSIARMDDGQVHIIKDNTMSTQTDTTPSAVHITKKGEVLVGTRAHDKWGFEADNRNNTFLRFKRYMGTNKQFHSSRSSKDYSPEELSSEVLKHLKSFVNDENSLRAAVITVPAAFDQRQIDATQQAAKAAGFDYCELPQEPIAAAMAYSIDKSGIEGYWLVFDLGGGTFDVALVKTAGGIISFVDHEGDNHLGGSDMDLLIVNEIIVPYLKSQYAIEKTLAHKVDAANFRAAWESEAEYAKITLSSKPVASVESDPSHCKDDNGIGIACTIEIRREQLERLVAPIIDRAIELTKSLLARKRLAADRIAKILLVGGPTYMPYIRQRVASDICDRLDFTVDPMTVVARGAALFASTRDVPASDRPREHGKIQLILGYSSTTVERQISLGLKIDRDSNKASVPEALFVEIGRKDGGWSTGRMQLVNEKAVFRLDLEENRSNAFTIHLYDGIGNRIDCEPNTVSVLQGTKLASATLPCDIGISAIRSDDSSGEEIFKAILHKNQPLPAKGSSTGKFFTAKSIRPGREDRIYIDVLQGKEGTKSTRNQKIATLTISGDVLGSYLPEGSELDVRIEVDESRRPTACVYVPYLDETFPVEFDGSFRVSKVTAEQLQEQLDEFKTALADVKQSAAIDEHAKEFEDIGRRVRELEKEDLKSLDGYDQGIAVWERLNELAIRLDDIERMSRWPVRMREIEAELLATRETVEQYGGEEDGEALERLEATSRKLNEIKDSKIADELKTEIELLRYKIWFTQPSYWIYVLKSIDESFDTIAWHDRERARKLISGGKDSLSRIGYSDDLKNTVKQLWDLMPDSDQEKTKKVRTDIPHYHG